MHCWKQTLSYSYQQLNSDKFIVKAEWFNMLFVVDVVLIAVSPPPPLLLVNQIFNV